MNPFAKNTATPNVLILGAGMRAGKLYQEVMEIKSQALPALSGFVALEDKDAAIPENLILPLESTLTQLVKDMQVTEIVVIQDHPAQQCPMQQLLNCKMAGVALSDLDTFLERLYAEFYEFEENFEPLLVNYN